VPPSTDRRESQPTEGEARSRERLDGFDAATIHRWSCAWRFVIGLTESVPLFLQSGRVAREEEARWQRSTTVKTPFHSRLRVYGLREDPLNALSPSGTVQITEGCPSLKGVDERASPFLRARAIRGVTLPSDLEVVGARGPRS